MAALVQPIHALWKIRVLAVLVVIMLLGLILIFGPIGRWMRSFRDARREQTPLPRQGPWRDTTVRPPRSTTPAPSPSALPRS